MKKPLLLVWILSSLAFPSCNLTTDVFEKDIQIPGQEWESSFKPQVKFELKAADTASLYDIVLVLRHTDGYNFNNLWIQGSVQEPGDSAARSERYDLTLGTNEKGWLGSGMDDVFEHRILLQPRTKFNKPGIYSFTIEQIMRQDPLKHVLNVGVRVEKSK